MALSANTPRAYELGSLNDYDVLASATIYEGSAVGSSGGYARALVAGDTFLGFAKAKAVESTAANGGCRVQVIDSGKVEIAVGSLAVTDIGKPVYASADGTFTLTAGSNSYIGRVVRYVSSGVGVVAFGPHSGVITALTDSTGGTAASTLAALTVPDALTDSTGGSASVTLASISVTVGTAAEGANPTNVNTALGAVRDAIASLAAQQAKDRAAFAVVDDSLSSLAAKVNEIIKILK